MSIIPREPCADGPCSGHDELAALMRGLGPIFEGRETGVIAGLNRAIGEWKTRLNAAICQEWREGDPCGARRLIELHARRWGFPVDCPGAALSAERLCDWIALIRECPPGTQGFIRAAIEFVAPGKGITVEFMKPDGPAKWRANSIVPEENAVVITAPPECFSCVEEPVNCLRMAQDGENPCRRYFIYEVECLARCVFPLGMSIGYRTDPAGPDGCPVFGVECTPICPDPFPPYFCR